MTSPPPTLYLGARRPIDGKGEAEPLRLPAHHLTTHAVVVGMTGSGKTGLLTVLVEEALGAGIPVLMLDVKGDLPNLLLTFPDFSPHHLEPWLEAPAGSTSAVPDLAAAIARERQTGLASWGIREPELAKFHARTAVRLITPGSSAGESLHVLSSLERPHSNWANDPEGARASLSAAVSLVLRLLDRDPDPAKSREHVLLSVLAECRQREGLPSDLVALLEDVVAPPVDRIGALSVDRFFPRRRRTEFAASLNALLASPSFATWRQGAPLDVKSWLTPSGGRTPAVIVSVAHLDDDERSLILGVLLEEVLTYVRAQPGSKTLRALLVFDEVYGFLPPHPASPPTKRPLVALMKQARAFGVGLVLATQNPMDLDYRALSNAGLWCVGRLQTDADRERVLEGLAQSDGGHAGTDFDELGEITKCLAPRWFVMRDVRAACGVSLVQPRWAMSYLRGPMTGAEMRRARGE